MHIVQYNMYIVKFRLFTRITKGLESVDKGRLWGIESAKHQC